jgi:DNA-binding MarR family transcriptional regulator
VGNASICAKMSLILEVGHALKAATQAARQKHNVNWTEARALTALLRARQGVSGLSNKLDITKQAAIKTVEALTSRQLLTRGCDPRDGRRRTIHLTPQGEDIARDISAAMRALLAKAYRQAGGDAVVGCDTVLTALNLIGTNP